MPPAVVDEIIRKLPLRVGLYVPDDLLQDWFPAESNRTPVERAREHARSLECEFEYYSERAEGVFWKWVPAL